MADIGGNNNTAETATDLGRIDFSTDTFTGNVGVSDSGHLFEDPVDYFKLDTADDVASVLLGFGTFGVSNLYTNYWKVFTFVPISGFVDAEPINYYYDQGSFDGLFASRGWTEAHGSWNPFVFDIIPGSELVFSVSVSSAQEDTPGSSFSNIVSVNYTLGLSVHDQVDDPVYTLGWHYGWNFGWQAVYASSWAYGWYSGWGLGWTVGWRFGWHVGWSNAGGAWSWGWMLGWTTGWHVGWHLGWHRGWNVSWSISGYELGWGVSWYYGWGVQ
ncbi:MAG: hypothetical protein AAF903_15520 [Pseudomonadota bacterium]